MPSDPLSFLAQYAPGDTCLDLGGVAEGFFVGAVGVLANCLRESRRRLLLRARREHAVYGVLFGRCQRQGLLLFLYAYLRCHVLAAEVFVGWQPSGGAGVALGAVGLGLQNCRVQPVVAIYWRWD